LASNAEDARAQAGYLMVAVQVLKLPTAKENRSSVQPLIERAALLHAQKVLTLRLF
jgi:hypothetical protein